MAVGGARPKSPGGSKVNKRSSVFKMKDPLGTCCVSTILGGGGAKPSPFLLRKHSSVFQYYKLYQDVKQLSKAGECFCKDLMAVFQQR